MTVAGRVMEYSEVLLENPTVVRGVGAESPRFDTSAFGDEVPFVMSNLPSNLPEALDGGGVLAGSVNGVPIYVYGDRIGAEEVFCISSGGDSICTDAAAPGGGGGTSSEYGPGGEVIRGWMVGDLPANVSVVVYHGDEGIPIGWQTPVAYASYMPVPTLQDEDGYYWEFYDVNGLALDGFGNPRT